jgi:glycosyltransferase involved in cell wall biosynthesis
MQIDAAAKHGGKRLKGLVADNEVRRPLVSIVTAVFNGQQHLAKCLDSVLYQDYPNIEHLVTDGGSTDGTLDVLRDYDDQIAYWKSEPDNGVYDAWNKSLIEARGEWICFLGSDDEFLPGAISAYMALAETHPEAEYLSSRERWVHPSGYERIRGGPWTWKKFSQWNCIAHVGSMHRRTLYDRFGIYDTSFGTASDYEFLLRSRGSLKTAFMPNITVMMRAGGMTDARGALADATRAKIVTGGRNATLAAMELRFAYVKFPLRPLRRALGRIVQK